MRGSLRRRRGVECGGASNTSIPRTASTSSLGTEYSDLRYPPGLSNRGTPSRRVDTRAPPRPKTSPRVAAHAGMLTGAWREKSLKPLKPSSESTSLVTLLCWPDVAPPAGRARLRNTKSDPTHKLGCFDCRGNGHEYEYSSICTQRTEGGDGREGKKGWGAGSLT
jgi:hypothetical protein